ncbi:MAG: hypothetical protein GC162_01615 [Planctomycetes bacterium]|nr:hypothetical protein [Planctomycetota bacterium]
MARERNNLKAGLFVLAGIVLAFAAIVILADFGTLFRPTQKIQTRFALSDGLKGLKTGAAVTIGGVPEGSVTHIHDELNADGVAVGKIVEFTIPADYKIFENAHLELDVPTIGSNTKLNIRSFGGPLPTGKPNGTGWQYEDGVDPPIPGGLAVSEMVKNFVKEMGIEDEQRRRIQNIIKNVDQLVAAVGSDPKPVTETITNVRDITAHLKKTVPELTDKAKAMFTKGEEALTTAKTVLDDNRPKINSVMTNTDKLMSELRGTIEENRPAIKTTLANAQDISDRVRKETITKVHTLLDKANAFADDIKKSTEQLKGFAVTQRPSLERTVANMRITSDQLKLAAIEVRRSPWRLLYKPTEKELETDNMYDAARSFALAAASLNETADALTALVKESNGALAPNDENLTHILDNLRATFEKYSKAEKLFWDAVDGKPAPPPDDKPASQ